MGSDRLGSDLTGNRTLLPYGGELSPTANGMLKFATYWRDAATGMDYADQRYYSPGTGRFLTADPYLASAGAENLSSWNRYAYVEGDPVNWVDPRGLERISNACDIYPNSPGCSPYASCAVYPDSRWCKSSTPEVQLPECYRPEGPAGESIDRNVEWIKGITKTYFDRAQNVSPEHRESSAMAALFIAWVAWTNKVREGGDWDYKLKGPFKEFEDFGNFNYRATAAALDIPAYIAISGGTVGVAQNIIAAAEHILTKGVGELPAWWSSGIPFLKDPYGDSAHEAYATRQGYEFYQQKKSGVCR